MTRQEIKYVELSFMPNIELVTVVRRFVRDFYERVLDKAALSDVGLATHELLENAIKYSLDGETTIRIEVTPGADAHELTITTRNRAAPEHLDKVKRLLHDLDEAPDVMKHYQGMVEEAMRRHDGTSGLGLARIRAEAELKLSANIAGNELRIVANTVLPASRGA